MGATGALKLVPVEGPFPVGCGPAPGSPKPPNLIAGALRPAGMLATEDFRLCCPPLKGTLVPLGAAFPLLLTEGTAGVILPFTGPAAEDAERACCEP